MAAAKVHRDLNAKNFMITGDDRRALGSLACNSAGWMASTLLAMASNLLAMTSTLVAMASNLLAMASNHLQPTSDGPHPSST